MLEYILAAIAILGGLATLHGNYRLIRDVGHEKPVRRYISLCVAPILILTTLIRHYRRARTGAFIALAGLWLMVPFFGNRLWEKQTAAMESATDRKHGTEDSLADVDEDEEAESAASAPGGREVQSPHLHRLTEKEKLVNQLNARLAWWHEQLQGRRASLDAQNAYAVREFNADAAAYAAFNELAKEKNQELLTLRSVAKR